ncbi:MAG: YqeG family HAD IIIA-type phosphatase [Clostridia bacterium]
MRFKPDLYVDSIFAIDFQNLKARGIKGLLLDVDNTLKAHYAEAPSAQVRGWLDEARAAGFALCIVSNGRQSRIGPFAHGIGLAAVGDAMKPSRAGFLRAAESLHLDVCHTAVVGDQLFTDILGGNNAGALTILVKPISIDEPFYVKLKRPLERLFLKKRVASSTMNESARQ